MKVLIPILVMLVLSCAPKVREVGKVCPSPSELFSLYAYRNVPPNFKVYGKLKYGPLRLPFMFAKSEGEYTLRVAKVGKLEVFEDRFCLKDKCYLLPAPPENLIFGKILAGDETLSCKENLVYLTHKGEVYTRTVVLEGRKAKEMILYNPRKNRTAKVIFGKEDPKGFFRSIQLYSEGNELTISIEEVRL